MNCYFVDARTATPHFPGIGRYITNLVTAMAGQTAPNEELQILIPPPAQQLKWHGAPWSETLTQSAQLHLLPSAASTFRPGQQWSIPKLIRHTRQVQQGQIQQGLGQQRQALYHTGYYLMPYVTGLPNVVTIHDLIALVLPQTVSLQARWLFRITTWAALRAATHVITVSESARQELLAYFPIAPERVTTIPHAAAERFSPQPAAAIEAARAAYQLPDHYIFYFGINKPHKNLVRLIEAYAQLDSTTAPLVIGGAWDERYPQAKEQVKLLGLQHRVRFLGPLSDEHLPAIYSGATLFVFPSLYEGFGLPVIEAMACGAPVVCSDATGLRDVAGDAALLFDPHDTGAIVASLRTALENPDVLADLRTRSLAQAKRFSWSATAQQTLAIYRQVVRQQGT